MAARSTKAGGFLLTVCILVGLVVGVLIRNPMLGVLTGTGVGILLTVVLWLVDRRGDR